MIAEKSNLFFSFLFTMQLLYTAIDTAIDCCARACHASSKMCCAKLQPC